MAETPSAAVQTSGGGAGAKIDFPFPFTPYQIQLEFMSAVYDTLEKKQIGIFESPTGTGKSLSLICGAMKWLRDKELSPLQPELESNEPKEESTDAVEAPKPVDDSQPDWIRDYDQKKKEKDAKRLLDQHVHILSRQKTRFAKIREQKDGVVVSMIPPASKRRKLNDPSTKDTQSKNTQAESEDDTEFLLGDYKSDDEAARDVDDSEDDEEDGKKSAKKMKKLAVYLGGDPRDDPDKVEEEEQTILRVRKIFYCSRTHSQLSQFAEEVKRSFWGKDVRMIGLGSRKTLCINPTVSSLPTQNQINDKCLDMMQSSDKKVTQTDSDLQLSGVSSKCEYLNQDIQPLLRDNALAKPLDLEDLVQLGKSFKTCPYYGARAATHSAELVVLPYQMILHKQTRESLGMDLRGNIVIFDEAHNLIDTVTAIHSVEISGSKLLQAHAQLSQYLQRYQDRLKPKNKAYIQQILFFIKSILNYITPSSETSSSAAHEDSGAPKDEIDAKIIGQNDFLFEAGIDNINLFKMEKFFRKSEIVKKVNGFCQNFQVEIKINKDKKISATVEAEEFERHRPALGLVESFAMSLTNRSADGRILVSKASAGSSSGGLKQSSIKFILLNPEYYFEDILTQARAVILAGGTMQPFSDFTSQLVTAKIPPQRLRFLSCDHVIPDENLLGVIADLGPSGQEFEFSYDHRRNSKMINELGLMVANLCSVVPDGLVIFFPSYSYEEIVMEHWKASGTLDRIGAKKRLFREPRHTSSIDETLQNYAQHIQKSSPGGAILSAVVGGKMSEGINFKDELGRCVIMVGLPYPNARDPVLLEKMAFVNHKANSDGGVKKSEAATEYYNNLCMKAVNQSIGRCIRHAKDYGAIVLVDKRFKRPQIQSRLPKWIQSRMKPTAKFGEVFSSVSSFFKSKKSQ